MAFNKYPHVYSPIQVGNMTLKNRIQYSPIVSNHAETVSGEVNEELLSFVGAQAASGAALVTIGSTPIDFDRARDFYSCLSATDENNRGGLSLLSREVHKYGAKLSTELTHGGQWAMQRSLEGKKAWVPSVIPGWHDPDKFQEITRPEMDEVIENWIKAVDLCMRSGFDMVMAHLAHGNLLSSFLSPAFNTRTDKYGGSPENRWRYPLEVLEAISSHTKGKIPIEVRVVGNEYIPNGADISERIAFLKEAQKYIDMVIVSAGILFDLKAMAYNMPGYYTDRGLNVPYAAQMKAALDIPVSVVGGISTLEQAEEIISSGKADIVAMAKSLMADPRMIVKGEKGREDDIRPCMRCLYCLRNNDESHLDGCAVNPILGWEYKYKSLIPVLEKKKVMIIGGGPGGMKAARLLSKRGHEVVLYEKSDTLGGRMEEASALYRKDGFKRYKDYAIRKTMDCDAKIVLGQEATAETIKMEAPDELIIACGAEIIVPNIKGIDGPNVVSVVDVDKGNKEVGNKVVICGGGLSGSECAVALGKEGKDVTIVDVRPAEELCSEMFPFSRRLMLDEMAEYDIKTLDCHGVKEFVENGVVVTNPDGEEVTLDADTIVLAFGVKPNIEILESLSSVIPDTHVIGDAKEAGLIGDAIGHAFLICHDM